MPSRAVASSGDEVISCNSIARKNGTGIRHGEFSITNVCIGRTNVCSLNEVLFVTDNFVLFSFSCSNLSWVDSNEVFGSFEVMRSKKLLSEKMVAIVLFNQHNFKCSPRGVTQHLWLKR